MVEIHKVSLPIKVEFEPSVRLVGGKRGITVVGDGSGPAALGQALGYPVELTCRVEAHPKPQITWLHDGVEVRKQGTIKIR